jgi:hypothetical protein
MKYKFLFIIFFSVSAYSQERFSLQDLVKLKWDSLTRGIDYISTKNSKNISRPNDSVEIKLIGFSDNEFGTLEMFFKGISSEISDLLTSKLKQRIPESKEGYLKVNLSEFFRPEVVKGKVFLRGDYSTSSAKINDSIFLLTIQGIKSLHYYSKEEAKKEYLAEGNTDWSKVLDYNPLPNSFDIELIDSAWTEKSLKELQFTILSKLGFASSVEFPTILFEKSDRDYYFKYKRK